MIVKHQKTRRSSSSFSEAYIAAMYLMFLRAPGQPAPDLDGQYWLGEIGEAREKNWQRLTPYSLAVAEPEDQSCHCGAPDCVGHEVVDEVVQFPGFTSRAAMFNSRHTLFAFNVPLSEATAAKSDLTSEELAAHPGPFLVHWRPRE